jgi:hypothetical protein
MLDGFSPQYWDGGQKMPCWPWPHERSLRAGSLDLPLTSQRLKEDEDRAEYDRKAAEYGSDCGRGILRVGNQVEEGKAHHQEDDEPLDPGHVGLLILPRFTAGYSSTLPHVQTGASMLS